MYFTSEGGLEMKICRPGDMATNVKGIGGWNDQFAETSGSE